MRELPATSNYPAERDSWRVRLVQEDEPSAPPLGAGVLLPGGLVLTCAHVVLPVPDPWNDESRLDEQSPLENICAEFPGANRPLRLRARVLPDYLRPPTAQFSGDIALLKLAEEPDIPATRLHRQIPARGERMHTIGYPQELPGGEDVEGRLKGRGGPGIAPEWVQLDAEGQSVLTRPGFSGSGVVHSRSHRVIGIVVYQHLRKRHNDVVGHTYMIPTETILKHLPPQLLGLGTGSHAVPHGVAVAPRQTAANRAPGLRRTVTRWLAGATAAACEAGQDPVELVFADERDRDALHAIHSTLTLADREKNPRSVSRADMDEPPVGTIDLAVDATGRKAAYLVARIADRIGLEIDLTSNNAGGTPDGPDSTALLDMIGADGPSLSAAFLSVDRTVPAGTDAMPLLRALRRRGGRLLLVFRDPWSPLLTTVVTELLDPDWAERRVAGIASRLEALDASEKRLSGSQESSGSRRSVRPPEPRSRQLRAHLRELCRNSARPGTDPTLPYELFRLDVAVEDARARAEAAWRQLSRSPGDFVADPPGNGLMDLPFVGVPLPEALVEQETDQPPSAADNPALLRGQELHQQYRVVGRLGQGSFGQVYLAHDLLLENRPVALKGLRDPEDRTAQMLANQERLRLVSLNHPSIIRVINYARHPDHPVNKVKFIVMEFADGVSLRRIADRIAAGEPPFTGFQVHEFIVAYGLRILAALTYLHDQGYVYGDLSLTNVFHCGDGIKLIDVAGVRPVGASGPVTHLPPELHNSTAMTIAGDLYTVGVVLRELLGEVPPQPADLGTRSLERALQRATAEHPEERFADAREMADQFRGVLRELRSLRIGEETFEPSPLFSPAPAALDGELGKAPPLDQWLDGGHSKRPLKARLPKPAEVAVGLPVPKSDRKDLNWKEMQRTSYDDPVSLLQLSSDWSPSPELALLRCRLHLDTARDQPFEHSVELASATRELNRARQLVGDLADYDWRLHWHEGLLHLARDRIQSALESFDRVYAAIPGEYAPKLALGYCHEVHGDTRQAEKYYEAVWQRNHALGSAAFGLARIHLSRGHPDLAVRLLEGVPADSRHRTAARIGVARIHTDLPADGRPPTVEGAKQACLALHRLTRQDGLTDRQARERLRADRDVLLLQLVLTTGTAGPDPLVALRGELPDEIPVPNSEWELREQLADSYRLLSEQARQAQHTTLAEELLTNHYLTRPQHRRPPQEGSKWNFRRSRIPRTGPGNNSKEQR